MEKQHKQVKLLNPDTMLTWEQRGGAAPLVLWRVLQLLVLGRSWGEDGGHRQQDGGSAGVTHLVDHDGGQSNAEQLVGGGARRWVRGSAVSKRANWLAHSKQQQVLSSDTEQQEVSHVNTVLTSWFIRAWGRGQWCHWKNTVNSRIVAPQNEGTRP